MAGMDEVKRSLADWCAVAAERTAEAARVTSRRVDRFALGREIERRYAELGSLVYRGLVAGRQDVLGEPRVAEIMAEVADLERERALKDEEISGIRQEHARRRGNEPGAPEAGRSDGEAGPRSAGTGDSRDRRPDISD